VHSRSLVGVIVALACASAPAQSVLPDVVVSASRGEQRRFDAPAAIDSVQVDPMRTAGPLVNLSELTSGMPGIVVRERQNYAQDLQIAVRGFGTRSTFGVRGVRLLVDGIPATMPDGQGQAATASLASASRVEVLRGPLAQLYGNAAGGVVQVFTRDPPQGREASVSLGFGSDGQRQTGVSLGGGNEALGGLIDVSRYETDGYRDHSAARRTQINAKLVAKPSGDTKITGIFNSFNQPLAQDPLGLTRAQLEQNPRQAVAAAEQFDTRKRIEQHQLGAVLEQQLSDDDTLQARVYGGKRLLNQTLAFSGAAPTSAGGVVDLDRTYAGAGVSWTHRMTVNGLPLSWTAGVEADTMREQRRGYVNQNGVSGALRRDEADRASNLDGFAQVDWTVHPQWRVIGGMRVSRVRFDIDDRYVTAASPNDSGKVDYRNASPVLGLVWQANDALNVYANLGRGFETPTLAEMAYRRGGTGPNLDLQPARSRQAEIGVKWRGGWHAVEAALFEARSRDEIVPLGSDGGRTLYQNVDGVRRRGAELAWRVADPAQRVGLRLAYTWLDATFTQPFANAQGQTVPAGNRLPGTARHGLSADVEYRPLAPLTLGLEWRGESRAYADDRNTAPAPGYGVLNLRALYAFRLGPARFSAWGRVDNLLDRRYAGSLIVNDTNQRFFEPAPGRRFMVGLRSAF
jgi:iron complex outermembrane receptor protein